MRYIISIILIGVGIAGLVSGTFYPHYKIEIFIGMLSPLMISIISIQLTKNIFSKNPEKLTSTLIKSFIFKMIFFAVYFIIILTIYTFEPIPIIISFTGFFILFYVIEAIFLKNLIQSSNK